MGFFLRFFFFLISFFQKQGWAVIFVKKFRFLMIFVLCLILSLPVQASNQLTLYSNWRAQITFDANGGVLTGGATDAERALAGQSYGTLSMSSTHRCNTEPGR